MSARHPILPPPTPGWLRDGFLRYNHRLLRRRFAAVRAAGLERMPSGGRGPVLVYLNHPAWWDPLACAVLAAATDRERRHVALIDEANLSGVLARLGFVGIEPGTVAGARRLVRLADEIAGTPNVTLWLTPQGRFADPRERPLRLAGGLARLARRLPDAVAVPLALEYPFLGARKAEMRLWIGEPVPAASADETTLEAGLERAMDALADHVVREDLAPFRTLVGPRGGEERPPSGETNGSSSARGAVTPKDVADRGSGAGPERTAAAGTSGSARS